MPEIGKKQRGRPKGSQNRATKEIREKISWAFDKVAGENGKGLIKLAENEPQIFYSLVARIIPQQATLAVSHLISLGDAMEAARDRLENMEPANVIDMQPAHNEHHSTVIDVQPYPQIPQAIDNIDESDLT